MQSPQRILNHTQPPRYRPYQSRILQSTAIALAISLLGGCTPPTANPPQTTDSSTRPTPSSPTSAPGPKVVATTSVLCNLVQEIAQTTVDLTCLIKAGEDPHVYTPKPEDRKAIDDAALVLYAGYDFEPALVKLIKASPNAAPKIAVNEIAVPQPLMGEAEHDHGHDHTKADDPAKADAASEKAPDPHVWHNAQNGVQMVNVIKTQLEKVAPANTTLYNKNAKVLGDRLSQLDRWIKAQIATIPNEKRKLITTHDALGYYAAAYGIPIEGALQGLSTEEKPTAARIKALVDEIKVTQVPTVFAEISANPKLITAVAQEAKVKLSQQELYADGLGAPGSPGDTYENMLVANTRAIVEGLGGQFTPFRAQ
jgi:manganese/iron transport system substrate-binding protein